jgi:hypothetical protein
MRTIEITHIKNSRDQKNVVLVPLTDSDKQATLYEDDFNSLVEIGVSPNWKYNPEIGGQVKVYCANRMLSVARILLNAGKGAKVQFLNGDRTDLRRDNLVIAPGAGNFRDRDFVLKSHKFFPNRPQLKHVIQTSNNGAGSVMH